jgi:hypothetical protein
MTLRQQQSVVASVLYQPPAGFAFVDGVQPEGKAGKPKAA